MLVPSIDLMDGKAVQLRQGKEKVLEREDVFALAEEFSLFGEIAVVDLDAAMGRGGNRELVKTLCGKFECRVGGGIRSPEDAEDLLRAGASKLIIGTRAEPEFLKQLPRERLIVAVDSTNGCVTTEGWTKKTRKSALEAVRELEIYCSEFLFTNVDKEGMMQGCDIETVKQLTSATKNKLTVAGGISTKEQVLELEQLGCNSQLGMALYTGKMSLVDAFVSLMDFENNKGLVPTIVQDEGGQVLMLAFSSPASLAQALSSRQGVYYSRSRKSIWRKGETSGNTQELLNARFDCDRDSLLFTVRQKNFACHTGAYSCFSEKKFGLQELYDVIAERIRNPRAGSYTSRLALGSALLRAKLLEECNEVLEADEKDKANLVWELADLLYFTSVLMASNNISFRQVEKELWRRRR